jgi:hypothetical protein
MRHSTESIFVIEYLREYESIFETASAKKTKLQKSRDTVPVKAMPAGFGFLYI